MPKDHAKTSASSAFRKALGVKGHRAARGLAYALVCDDEAAFWWLAACWSLNLTPRQRAVVAFAGLVSLESPEQAVAVMEVVEALT